MRERVKTLVDSRQFSVFILTVIIINSIVIGLQTAELPADLAFALNVFDSVCLCIYIVEMILKLVAYRTAYFKDGWNVFDFIIILASLVPAGIVPFPVQVARILRVLRIFRVFRLVSAFAQLRIIVQAIGRSIPGVAWTAFLLIIVYYVFAIIGTNMFGKAFPDWFGDLGASFYTLFQVMTLESWSMGIARPVIEVFPWAWAYFVPFVVISAFIIVNVVVGIMVNVVDETSHEGQEKRAENEAMKERSKQDRNLMLKQEIVALKKQVSELEKYLD